MESKKFGKRRNKHNLFTETPKKNTVLHYRQRSKIHQLVQGYHECQNQQSAVCLGRGLGLLFFSSSVLDHFGYLISSSGGEERG